MKRTDLERQAWRDRMSAIAKQVAGLSDAERAEMASRMLITTCEGHTLSARNNCLLIWQYTAANGIGAPPLTMVGGYRQWGKVGRTVRKGEHACGYILVPIGSHKDDETGTGDAPRPDGKQSRSLFPFRHVPVFDVTQTEAAYSPSDETPDTEQVTVRLGTATVAP